MRTSATCSRLPTDSTSDAVFIGRVGRPHLVEGRLARVTVSRQVGARRRAIKLDRPVERGAQLTVRREDLGPLPEDTYYVADLVGLVVIEADGTSVGFVRDVLPGPANDALELDNGLLLPVVEDCIRDVDLAGRRVHLNPGFTG